ncbi:DNA repair exonuclease [Xylophilus sp. Kf1]|nr:DNA repair exonuclease [Xylophilus sp. Kf1]
MLKFLHTADWQIGRVFAQFEEDDAAALFEARFRVIERIAAIAARESVDAVLVAGDVFDAQTVSDKTIRRMFLAMTGFGGPWVLIPGNHDAALAESVWERARRLQAVPANVVACLAAEPHLLPGKCVLLPAPLTQRHTHHDLTAWFDGAPTEPGLPRIGLAHGSVSGILAEGIDSSNPIAPDRAATARLDYLALGDWHGTRRIDARTWYAGTPETDRFKGNDSGQALLVGIAAVGAEPQVQPLATGEHRWRSHELVLAGPSDVEQVEQWLAAAGRQDVLQLRLSGSADLAGHRRLREAAAAAAARVRALLWDDETLRLEPTDDDIAALDAGGYVGEVLAVLRAEQAAPAGGDGAEVARDALLALARVLDDHARVAA